MRTESLSIDALREAVARLPDDRLAPMRQRALEQLRERGLREKSEIHFCSPIARAFTIESVSEMATPELENKGIELHTFFNVESIDPERKVVMSLEGE